MEEKSSATELANNSSRLISFTYHVMVDKHNYSVHTSMSGKRMLQILEDIREKVRHYRLTASHCQMV